MPCAPYGVAEFKLNLTNESQITETSVVKLTLDVGQPLPYDKIACWTIYCPGDEMDNNIVIAEGTVVFKKASNDPVVINLSDEDLLAPNWGEQHLYEGQRLYATLTWAYQDFNLTTFELTGEPCDSGLAHDTQTVRYPEEHDNFVTVGLCDDGCSHTTSLLVDKLEFTGNCASLVSGTEALSLICSNIDPNAEYGTSDAYIRDNTSVIFYGDGDEPVCQPILPFIPSSLGGDRTNKFIHNEELCSFLQRLCDPTNNNNANSGEPSFDLNMIDSYFSRSCPGLVPSNPCDRKSYNRIDITYFLKVDKCVASVKTKAEVHDVFFSPEVM